MKKTVDYSDVLRFYKGRTVLITGNTGFKGSWLTYVLLSNGANVIGYSQESPTEPSIFNLAGLSSFTNFHQVYGDVRDLDSFKRAFVDYSPEIVFHLAAQPIVRTSYKDPVYTYSTNVMGTVNLLECVRCTPSVKSVVNITTDKVYKNNEWEYGYRENDELNGFDPYSNSKSCSELVTHSYRNSFFSDKNVAISTARAGNVIGGGDFSTDRIVPDCVRAISEDGSINVRNPYSTRPYQHVLEPLFAYMLIAEKQYNDISYSGCYNVGPDDIDCVSTGELTTLFCDTWNAANPEHTLSWINRAESNQVHEALFLKLDCSKMKKTFHWHPQWHISQAVYHTVNWTKVWLANSADVNSIREEMDREIQDYLR